MSVAAMLAVTGCANPQFRVPYEYGYPNASSINLRIYCELADMIRKKPQHKPAFPYRDLLLQGNYRMAAVLSLGTKRTASARPTLNASTPITAGTFKFDVGANLSHTVDRNSTTYLEYSIKAIHDTIESDDTKYQCEPASGDLSGDLGLDDLVATAAPLPIRQDEAGQGGQFGGSITFTVVSGISSLGPTWVLQRVSGPGAFGSLSNEHTNKLTVAFYQQPHGAQTPEAGAARQEARRILSDINNQDMLQQLNTLNSRL